MGIAAAESMVIRVGSCLQAKADCQADAVISDPLVIHINGDVVWVVDDCGDLYHRSMAHFVENYVELDFLPDESSMLYDENSGRIAQYVEEPSE